jgi:4-hydroxymandelate oxidase
VTLAQLQAQAAQKLRPEVWDFIDGGSGDELTLRANRSAFDRIELRPRVLVDVTQCDLSTQVLGTPVQMPILVAPLAFQRLVHPEGELASARAARACGTLSVAATLATVTLEETAVASGGAAWFQLYVFRDRAVTEALVARAAAAGYRALVVTVDAPRLGARDRDRRNGFTLPADLLPANLPRKVAGELGQATPGRSALGQHADNQFERALTWKDLEWLRLHSKLPLILKGVLSPEDARLAAEHGADGVVVSNHGGRQLDGAQASIDALPEVVEAVGGRIEVFLDGGIRRGTDVLKAVAAGARAVLVGRPVLWGLAVEGEAGVRQVLELLRQELELAMVLAGCSSLSKLDATFLVRSTR